MKNPAKRRLTLEQKMKILVQKYRASERRRRKREAGRKRCASDPRGNTFWANNVLWMNDKPVALVFR